MYEQIVSWYAYSIRYCGWVDTCHFIDDSTGTSGGFYGLLFPHQYMGFAIFDLCEHCYYSILSL